MEIELISELRPEGWPDISPKFEFYVNSNYCYPMMVEANNQIVGVGTSIIHNDVAWLAHIIVRPEFRNNGIGNLITRTLIANSIEQNCETIYLCATELGARVYSKQNFETETEYLFYEKLQVKSSNISNKIKPIDEKYREQVIQIDCRVSGENRLSSLADHLENGYVYLENGIVKGFYLPTLVDGLIIALSNTAGVELMKLRLNTFHNAVFPSNNLTAKTFLTQNNYLPYKTEQRMRFGKKRPVALKYIYNRIGGKLG